MDELQEVITAEIQRCLLQDDILVLCDSVITAGADAFAGLYNEVPPFAQSKACRRECVPARIRTHACMLLSVSALYACASSHIHALGVAFH